MFTGLSVFLYSNFEVLPLDGYLEAGLYADGVDYSGEREVLRQDKGFAITRPNSRWGVAKKTLRTRLGAECDLMLVNPYRHGYVQVMTEPKFDRGLENFADDVIRSYQHSDHELFAPSISGFKLRQRRPLKPDGNLSGVELVFDLRVGGEELTYVAHLIQSAGHEDFFRVVAWSARRRFTHLEDEMRRALDSFRLLP